MPAADLNILFHWLTNTPELLERACVVVVMIYMAIRLEWFRKAMRGAQHHWRYRLITIVFFSALAIFGTHNGIVLDVRNHGAMLKHLNQQPNELRPAQAIIGFRDTMVLAAGLCAGPWTGLGAGLIAGSERYLLGGFVASASGLATLLLGIGAGLAQQYWPLAQTPKGTVLIALLGTLLQRLLIYLLTEPQSDAIALIWETIMPVTVVNCFGCLLFVSVVKDLERESLAQQAQQAELRALHAQVEPHFINNTLNAIKALIRSAPESAANYVIKLAHFLNLTRECAKANSISLRKELEFLSIYLDFQQLRFPGTFIFQPDIPAALLDFYLPTRCLLTLVENVLLHATPLPLRDPEENLHIALSAKDQGDTWVLCMRDNGCGIAPERLKKLGKQAVSSERGNGVGLQQLNHAMQLVFENRAKLLIHSQLNQGTAITLILPKRNKPW